LVIDASIDEASTDLEILLGDEVRSGTFAAVLEAPECPLRVEAV
jgi:hypothetical protein